MSEIIIFEGPDNCGKSTQIKRLLKHLIDRPTYVIHYSGIPGITPEEALKANHILYNDMFYLISEAYLQNRNLIFDRSHIGEYVYGPMYRHYNADYIFDIEEMYSHTEYFSKIKLFVFVDEPENLIKREDGQSFSIELENKQKEISLFKEAFAKSFISDKWLININNKSIDEISNAITDGWINKWRINYLVLMK